MQMISTVFKIGFFGILCTAMLSYGMQDDYASFPTVTFINYSTKNVYITMKSTILDEEKRPKIYTLQDQVRKSERKIFNKPGFPFKPYSTLIQGRTSRGELLFDHRTIEPLLLAYAISEKSMPFMPPIPPDI